MLELTVVAARLAQYAGGVLLMGLPAFLLYSATPSRDGRPKDAWARPLLRAAALTLFVATLAALSAQTATMTGDAAEAFNPSSVLTVLTGTQIGLAMGARLVLALVAVACTWTIRPGRPLWALAGLLGTGAVASFAWTGHAAAGEGAAGVLHLVSDVTHLVSGGLWLGALAAMVALLIRLQRATQPGDMARLYGALHRFSGVGSVLVALLVLSGLVNTWFLVTPAHVSRLLATPYGVLLVIKIVLFLVMLACAASNRFLYTPRLGVALNGSTDEAVRTLRLSILLETACGVAVIIIVSILGTLPPPASM